MKNIKALKITALIFLGWTSAILLLFLIGETFGGDWSGLGHLVQAIPIILLMWLGWKHPLWGGVSMLVLGLITAHSLAPALRGQEWLAPFLIIIAPLLLSGSLLLGAAWVEKKTTGT